MSWFAGHLVGVTELKTLLKNKICEKNYFVKNVHLLSEVLRVKTVQSSHSPNCSGLWCPFRHTSCCRRAAIPSSSKIFLSGTREEDINLLSVFLHSFCWCFWGKGWYQLPWTYFVIVEDCSNPGEVFSLTHIQNHSL